MATKLFLITTLAFMLIKTNCGLKKPDVKQEINLFIQHYKMPCMAEGVQWCYIIKNKNGKNELFYDEIEGFQYQWGYSFVLLIEKKMVQKPMEDASFYQYKLIKIVKKEKAATGEQFQLSLKLDGKSFIQNTPKGLYILNEIKLDNSLFSLSEIQKADSAVFVHGKNEKEIKLVKVNL